MTDYWTYKTTKRNPSALYLPKLNNTLGLITIGNTAPQYKQVYVDENISRTNPKWNARIHAGAYTWIVPYTTTYTITITGTGGNQQVVTMPLTQGTSISGTLGSAAEEGEMENPENPDSPFYDTIPASNTTFGDTVVKPIHNTDQGEGSVQITGTLKVPTDGSTFYLVVATNEKEAVDVKITQRIESQDYVDDLGTVYKTLPVGAQPHVSTDTYVETNESYQFTMIQNTTWTPPKAGRVRVTVEAGQNYKNYNDNINGERVVVDMDITQKPYTLIVGKNGNWDHDADRYKPTLSQFGDVIAHVGPQYPVLKDRKNGLSGFIKVTYLRKES